MSPNQSLDCVPAVGPNESEFRQIHAYAHRLTHAILAASSLAYVCDGVRVVVIKFSTDDCLWAVVCYFIHFTLRK